MSILFRARKIAKQLNIKEDALAEELAIMHQLINELVDTRIPIRLEGLFKTTHTSVGYTECKKVGKNKRLVKSALVNNKNLYIRTEHKFVNPKK